MKKYCYIDYEFNSTKQSKVNLVCCSYSLSDTGETYDVWLHNDKHTDPGALEGHKKELRRLIEEGYIFIAWAAVAEARSFISVGLDPIKAQFIDLFLEYRCLKNHSDEIGFGKQLIDGKPTRTSSKPWAPNYKKGEDGLAAACYKLLDVLIDTDHKNFVRDLIISAPEEFSVDDRVIIQRYCRSDIVHLPSLFKKIVAIYTKRLPRKHQELLKDEMLARGNYAARTAVTEAGGYPYSPKVVKNFANSVSYILDDLAIDINSQFPDMGVFKRVPATRRFSKKEKPQREWIEKSKYSDKWTMTKGGKKGIKQTSLALDAFTKFFAFTHDYPRGNFGAQMVRYLKTKQSLNGFVAKNPKPQYWDALRSDGEKIVKQKSLKKSRTFFDYTDPVNGRVHPYMNIFGSQSARNQPSATGFLPLKAAWLRALIEPKPGKSLAGIDFAQQEFFIKMLVSNDKNGIKAYQSGDVYLWFGKAAGEIPPEATKKSHKAMRDKFKATTLAIQFAMTKVGLAVKLSGDTGVEHSEEQAQELIDLFEETFPEATEHGEELLESYREDGFLKLPCGWYMFGDNPNDRSVKNMPIQGFGSSILRKAIQFAQDAGLNVIYSLHDALNIEYDSGDLGALQTLAECMDRAFRFYLPEHQKEIAYCRLDANIWGPDHPEEDEHFTIDYTTEYGVLELPIKQQRLYIDSRSKPDYDRFSMYFKDIFHTDLL